jgi:hypothetical protein
MGACKTHSCAGSSRVDLLIGNMVGLGLRLWFIAGGALAERWQIRSPFTGQSR